MNPIVGMRFHLRGHNYNLCQAEYDKLSAADQGLYEAIPPPVGGSLGAAQLRDETGRAEVVAELELIFPTASRVHIERALEAAIQIGGDRNEAALLLLEPDEV